MPAQGQGDEDGLYRRLDVGPGASSEEIGRAYRRLAHGAHPDAHPDDPGAARRFQEITQAYEILRDPGLRARYDRAQDRSGASSAGSPATDGRVRRRQRSTGTFAGRPTQAAQVVVDMGPILTGSVPLVAGPVHWESPAQNLLPAHRGELPAADLARLLAFLLGPRW